MKKILFSATTFVAVISLVLAGCGDDNESDDASSAEKPLIVVTTNILGDVVTNMVGDSFDVETIMPPGSDPHDFQASAQQVQTMMSADLLVVNGANFEEGMLDVIENAESDGVMIFEAMSVVSQLEGSDDHGHGDHDDHEGHDDHDEEKGHDDHDDHEGHDHDEEKDHDDHEGHDHDEEKDHEGHEGHDDHDEEKDHDDHEGHDHDEEKGHDDHDDHEGHDHGGIDPHFFTDPARMAVVAQELSEFLVANFPDADQGFVTTANDYIKQLQALDSEVEETLSAISSGERLLVTNHTVFAYFADRYSFTVLGEIIPSSSTLASASAQQLASLAEEIKENQVKAIFADASSSDALAQTLSDEVNDVEVINLYTESLGDPGSSGDSYIDMIRFNAEAIASALVE
ncbi:MAG: metal ABC transporter substrate-binding protein [Acidimicrobiales bacterium]|nr:metal ABC transporter substrate-binding protein [Acidimicrobiales bacterium]